MVDNSKRQAGKIEITPKMIEAGVRVYQKWEPKHVFGDFTPPADYAVEELAKKMFRAMTRSARNIRGA